MLTRSGGRPRMVPQGKAVFQQLLRQVEPLVNVSILKDLGTASLRLHNIHCLIVTARKSLSFGTPNPSGRWISRRPPAVSGRDGTGLR